MNSHYRELKQIHVNMEALGFEFIAEDKIIYCANKKFEILNLTDQTKVPLFNFKNTKLFKVIGDRFIVSRDGAYKSVMWNLKTSEAIRIKVNGLTTLLALKSGKLLIATWEESSAAISIWHEKESAAEGELPFEKIKEISDAHKNKITNMIELPDNMVATQSSEVINVWNNELSDILCKLNEDDISASQHVFDDTLMVENADEYLFWNYKKNVVLSRFDIYRNYPRLAFATHDKKFLVILIDDEMRFFDTNGFYFYEAFPALDILKKCKKGNTVVKDGVFYLTANRELQVFRF